MCYYSDVTNNQINLGGNLMRKTGEAIGSYVETLMHTKEVLSEFIYRLNEKKPFLLETQRSAVVGFAYDHSLPSEFMLHLSNKGIIKETMANIICILGDGYNATDGIIFTYQTLYVLYENGYKRFRVRYDKITELEYFTNHELDISTEQKKYVINMSMWNLWDIHDFLEFARGTYDFSAENKEKITQIKLNEDGGNTVGSVVAGITYSNISNASSIFYDDKILTPRGHGFAAENANHLTDLYQGKDAKIVGNDNAKNGADRIVNGVSIQSKYCSSGSKCVQECFENGKFRYWNSDGTPMQIEVPSDMYDAAVQAMESRIKRGEVKGVSDPAEAKNIIRQGHFKYAQVKNIAKAGSVESILYDAASGAIIAKNSFGITAVLTFATEVWNGEEMDIALKTAAAQGIKVGGTAFITAVLAGQLSKAGLNSALAGSSKAIVKALGPKASAALANAFRQGTNIYGAAAMKSAEKLLRGNMITGIASFAVLSIGDVGNIFQGRISGGQLFKNMASTASSIAGGAAGFVVGTSAATAAGAAIGSVIPGIGTLIGGTIGSTIGGLLGAFGGGSLASGVSGAILDEFIEDDADRMVRIIQEVFTDLAGEYLINQSEAERITDQLKSRLSGSLLKDMYASSNQKVFARRLLQEYFENEANNRAYIPLPTVKQMQKGVRMALEGV